MIKAVYLGEDENSKTLQNLIDYHSGKIEKTLASGTNKNFKITDGYLFKFLIKERKTSDIYLRELDYRFLCDFENYLIFCYPKDHSKAMSHNTAMKHIQRLRKMVTQVYRKNSPSSMPDMRNLLTEREIRDLVSYLATLKEDEMNAGKLQEEFFTHGE
ncbi:phage integrase SAM-like domain-containing protein [Autumnicola edwardsiae]|uniref:Phage integrase SAM-like domain-containing protein n=1 Tax=Autumnicola edwardsiae TaxID=3075594 RepID=A0ABU3CXM1_9FLAO|nr:phage integrase SAM-like domain-containing protein [Zunongwangia sp. F297]MDT0651113.1 phage integrase SAM-like domain-containing protein [Zunongwangia sp. F297]